MSFSLFLLISEKKKKLSDPPLSRALVMAKNALTPSASMSICVDEEVMHLLFHIKKHAA